KFNPFPEPKKGKARMVLKRPASVKSAAWKKVPYVRGARRVPARGVRREHGQWKRNAYKLKLPGVRRDPVVHKKKR
ncbi:Uncharacterized protein SCF082_LOCUS28700, partial [Durusdinium trenchii]